jgi:hypothetical protein
VKKGSPEWMRAKYAEMMVAHLSIFGEGQPPSEPAKPYRPNGSDGPDQPARTDAENTPQQGGHRAP